jgi:hypothetical protein
MNQGRYVFKQIVSYFPKYEFDKIVSKYKGHYKVQSFSCWSQLLCLCFGQLTQRESLRDIVLCLQSQSDKLYHLGIRQGVARSTLADANENRDWRIYAEFAQVLIAQARRLYSDGEDFRLELENTVYALDATTIDLCLSVFPWSPSTKNRAALKLHTLMDLRGSIPVWIRFSNGLTHDMNMLAELHFESGAFYIMDRGYMKLEQLYRIHLFKAFFVIRAKKSLKFKRRYSNPKPKQGNIIYDQIGVFETFYSKKKYPEPIRSIKATDPDTGKTVVLLTNNFEVDAQIIADLYRYRWQIELFFKWIKQHLRIKKFWGESPNAVKTQIWVAVATYVLVAIVKKKLNLDLSIYEILQILSVSVFDKTPVNQLLSMGSLQNFKEPPDNQLIFRW